MLLILPSKQRLLSATALQARTFCVRHPKCWGHAEHHRTLSRSICAHQPFQDATDLLLYVQLTTTDGHRILLSASHYLPAAVSPVAAPADATMTPAGQV